MAPVKLSLAPAKLALMAKTKAKTNNSPVLKSTPEEGTLLPWVFDFVPTPGTSTMDWIKMDAADDTHIKKWTSSIEKGLDAFSCDFLHDQSRVNAKPLAFAVMVNGEPFVQIAPGFRQLALVMEDHVFDGVLGCFQGDIIIMSFQGNTVIQEPDFVALRNPNSLRCISTKTAADSAIWRIQMGDFVSKNVRGDVVDLPLCLPLPLLWVPYFLEKRRANHKAYIHISKHMELWEGSDATSTMVLGWFHAACTRHTSSLDYSLVDMGTRAIPRNAETVPWTMAHLQAIVPWPTQLATQGKTTKMHIPCFIPFQMERYSSSF
jgi:hypothetical protein